MRNREYWQKRFSAVEEMRNKRGRLTVDQIAPHFDRAQAAIDKEIRVWYQRIADNNGISLAEAKKLLRQNELDELKWDIEEKCNETNHCYRSNQYDRYSIDRRMYQT